VCVGPWGRSCVPHRLFLRPRPVWSAARGTGLQRMSFWCSSTSADCILHQLVFVAAHCSCSHMLQADCQQLPLRVDRVAALGGLRTRNAPTTEPYYYNIFGTRTCGKGEAVRYAYTHRPLEVGTLPWQGLHLFFSRTLCFATARQRVMCRESNCEMVWEEQVTVREPDCPV
jgi:hypothetical protein